MIEHTIVEYLLRADSPCREALTGRVYYGDLPTDAFKAKRAFAHFQVLGGPDLERVNGCCARIQMDVYPATASVADGRALYESVRLTLLSAAPWRGSVAKVLQVSTEGVGQPKADPDPNVVCFFGFFNVWLINYGGSTQ